MYIYIYIARWCNHWGFQNLDIQLECNQHRWDVMAKRLMPAARSRVMQGPGAMPKNRTSGRWDILFSPISSGKRLHFAMDNHHFYWENSLFRLGHGFNSPEGRWKKWGNLIIEDKPTQNLSGWWWLSPTPLKNDGVSNSWGDDIPNIWKKSKCSTFSIMW